MGLSFQAGVAARGFEAAFELADGEHLAVLGPNGAGKSTLLGLVAGTVRPDSGTARLGARRLFDVTGGHWLPPHARGTALLAQAPLLFPHLSVLDNVAFGPTVAGVGRARARRLAEHWLAEVEAGDLAGRRPGELSGGQAQRVAVARALAAEPAVLLLDEPLAALDVTIAPALRRLLRRVLTGRTTVVVTHDLLDAVLLADRTLVLDAGRVVELGPTEQVLTRPRTRFTARVAGLNLVRGTATTDGLAYPSGVVLQGMAAGPLPDGEPAVAVFEPAAVSIYLSAPDGSPRNLLPVVVTEIEPRGGLVRVRADDGHGHLLAADITPRAVADLDLYPGRRVVYSLKATAVTLYPA